MSTSTNSFSGRPVAKNIYKKLSQTLEPVKLEIQDQSHLHKGHAGAPDGGESHFDIIIVSHFFEDKSRVSRQKIVYNILKDELHDKIHALSLKTLTPEEFKNKII